MDIKKCKHEFGKWQPWVNEYPAMFQSLKNEIAECQHCGIIIFKYKPEGSMNRKQKHKGE